MRESGSKKKADRKRFVVGDWVQWTSSATGTTKTKKGRVVLVIPTKGGVQIMIGFRKTHRIQCAGWPRDHESYLVEVQKGNGKPVLYHPRVSALQGVDA